MKLKALLLVIFAVMFASCSSVGYSVKYDCDFYEQRPAPVWVKYAMQDHPQYYYGKGMAHKNKNGFQAQFEEAQHAAVDDMAQSIQTMVENYVSRSSFYRNGKLNYDEVMKLSFHYTKLLLRGYVRDDQWIDQDSCTVWIRVRAKKKGIDSLLSEQLAEKQKLDQANYYADKADSSYYYPDVRLQNIYQAERAIKGVNFSILSSSGLADGPYEFYASKYSNIRQKINKEVQIRKEKAYKSYDLVKINIRKAERLMTAPERACKPLRIAEKNMNELKENIKFTDLKIVDLEKKLKEIAGEYEKQKRFLNSLHIGMISFPSEEFGPPKQTKETCFGGNKGYKYGYYWLIYKRGILDCVIKEADFLPYGSSSLYDCKEHRENKVIPLMD